MELWKASLLLLFAIVAWASPSIQEPIYTVTAPAKLRPNSHYNVEIDLENATEAVTFQVSLSGSQRQLTESVQVGVYSTGNIAFQIGAWTDGQYKLKVASKELNFTQERDLQFESKSFSTFVQTDKAIYKPGQTVRFRVIVVDPELLPTVHGLVDVYLKDSKDNLIKQWKQVSLSQGIFSGEVKLSEQPPLGDWSLKVEVQEHKFSKTFAVAEYVLPTFSVDLELPSYATYSKSQVVATVKAAYTYGKPVKGQVSLTVQPANSQSNPSVQKFHTKAQIVSTDGSVDIPVDLVKELALKTANYDQEIEFIAEVEETLTGKKYTKTGSVKLHEREFKVEVVKLTNTYKPGMLYTAFIKVATQDDQPVPDNSPALDLKYGFTFNQSQWITLPKLIPSKGLIRVNIPAPMPAPVPKEKQPEVQPQTGNVPVEERIIFNPNYNTIPALEWEVEYRGFNYRLEQIEAAQSPSNSFLELKKVQADEKDFDGLFGAKPVKVGQHVSFEVKTSDSAIHAIRYKLIAKGQVLDWKTVPFKTITGKSLEITVTDAMAPKAHLVAYYIRDDVNHEVVADSASFKVDGAIKTHIQLSSTTNQTEPGKTVDLSIKTRPSAYVGLLGVDQSVLLLKSGNDITEDDLMKELDSYDGTQPSNQIHPGPIMFNDMLPWRFRPIYGGDSSTAGEIFDNSGLIVITNGLIYHKPVNRWPIFDFADGVHPPMPAPMPEEKGGKPDAPKGQSVKLRTKFPETWIWADVTAGSDGVAKFSSAIPDTITSWVVSAFAMDQQTGLGVAEDNLKIAVFRPFFIQLSLPYSIIRGESVVIKVLVFNYQKDSVAAQVTMENLKEEFEFSNAVELKEVQQTASVAAFDATVFNFVITPKKLGMIDIRVKASTAIAGDAISKKLLVKPEGQTQYFNKAMFIKMDQGAEKVKRNFTIDVPANVVPGSLKAKVSGISDILGPTLNNIEDLLRMPYGCGEQNMINFVPNIVVLNYLTNAGRLTSSIKAKALSFIETGYQRELTYRRTDGSFSAFGNQDKEGSTWLTAYVVKSFVQASPFFSIEQNILSQAVQFLLTRQQSDGSFVEKGEMHHKDLQGGAADSAGALTAYVLIAILHDAKAHGEVPPAYSQEAIKKAEAFVYARLSQSSTPYEVALITYALQLGDFAQKEVAYDKLMTLAKRDVTGLLHWTGKAEEERPEEAKKPAVSDYLHLPQSLDVESSAYALLTMVARHNADNSIPILRWLISKQNSNGGFASTQDTVIGLQALGAIAEQLSASKLALTVAINHASSKDSLAKTEQLEFTSDNALVLQQIDLNLDTQWVQLEASGTGTAVVQVSYQYNIAEAAEKPAFGLEVAQDKSVGANNIKLNICTSYKEGDSTNMAVMEVVLPSGFTTDLETTETTLRQLPQIKRIDLTNDDGTVVIYFDYITKEKQCLSVAGYRAHQVANNKPVPVTVYDYYDRSKLSRVFYEPAQMSVKEISA